MSNLDNKNKIQQIDLFDYKKREKENKLNQSLDKIRKKYGYYAVRRAKTLNKDFINYFEVDEED